MRLLSWNIQQGGNSRAAAITSAVRDIDPDVLVLTEVRTTSTALLAMLSDRGWRYQAVGVAPTGCGAAAVLSRWPLVRREDSPTEVAFAGRRVEATIPQAGMTIVAIYGPRQTDDFEGFWTSTVADLRARDASPTLIAGDLNTGEALLDAKDPKFFCSQHFAAVKQLGFDDIWRRSHGDLREYSWYSQGKGGVRTNGFRIDHALASTSLSPRMGTARYLHSSREQRISDHSPLLIEFVDAPVRTS
jgi:exonuclease III